MKKIACFSIPAHGHTNPMLPVVEALVKRGNVVRFYSFDAFKEKIEKAGATFVSCDSFMHPLTPEAERKLKNVSATEMTVQDIALTLGMDGFLCEEFAAFKPDIVYTDAVCFWGKLIAKKHHIPLVVSTSTLAFNRLSSQYMKHSPEELADMIFGLPKMAKALKELHPYGYNVQNPLELVQNDNETDTVVYTSERFQPYAKSFSDRYAFVGPSVFSKQIPQKETKRPLIYIALGTVINERPDFYRKCIEALKDLDADVLISCGTATDPVALGPLPENITALPYVDQPEVLARANVFITHCGMNSVSESLYMATPMVLFPQTGEQKAVATKVTEIGAGTLLKEASTEAIRKAVLEVLSTPSYADAAAKCCEDFRGCAGAEGAADFIETAPHKSEHPDPLTRLNKAMQRVRLIYWLIALLSGIVFGLSVGWKYVWIIGLTAGVLSYPIESRFQQKIVKKLYQ